MAFSVFGSSCRGSAVSTSSAESMNWPRLRPIQLSLGVQLNAQRIYLDVPLTDVNDRIRYRLICRGGSNRYLEEVERETDVSSYVNELLCILNEGEKESDNSLLAEDDRSPVHTRGHFSQNSLLGACGEYPEYGLVRRFRLRGFELKLALSNLVVAPGNETPVGAANSENRADVQYAVMTVSVEPNPAVKTARPEQPGYIDPRGEVEACATIKRGNEPRMCRDFKTSAWEKCPPGWEFLEYPEKQENHGKS